MHVVGTETLGRTIEPIGSDGLEDPGSGWADEGAARTGRSTPGSAAPLSVSASDCLACGQLLLSRRPVISTISASWVSMMSAANFLASAFLPSCRSVWAIPTAPLW